MLMSSTLGVKNRGFKPQSEVWRGGLDDKLGLDDDLVEQEHVLLISFPSDIIGHMGFPSSEWERRK